jgi:hypothetical protein
VIDRLRLQASHGRLLREGPGQEIISDIIL